MALLALGPVLVLCAALVACDTSPLTTATDAACKFDLLIEDTTVVSCLRLRGAISGADSGAALGLLADAAKVEDSLAATGAPGDLDRSGDLIRARSQLGDFYSRQLFPDSVRFHRMMDRIAISIDNGRGSIPYVDGLAHPTRAPYQVWHPYVGLGLYFQPIETAQLAVYSLPRADVSTDSLLQVAQHLYAYALWRTVGGLRYPVWEYEFDWMSGGVPVRSPWISSLAEGVAMMVFTESYLRTSDPVWGARALETLNALRVSWDRGGVLLPDTTHGYWWEGYHPVVQVWNEGAEALVAVAYLYNATLDSGVKAMYNKGAAALKYYTPFYDTGTWTLYSRTQGYNGTYYHALSIERLDALYSLTGDPWYKTTADRWRTYTPPPGLP